jgi:hypothetical protein
MPPLVQDAKSTETNPAGRSHAGDMARMRCRSFCFLERGASERWTAFLITYRRGDGQWRGYFTFRSAAVGRRTGELRTADLFLERDEQAWTSGRGDWASRCCWRCWTRRWRRTSGVAAPRRSCMAGSRGSSCGVRRSASRGGTGRPRRRWRSLRSLYDSYRLDQVAHLVALLDPDDFREMVEVLLAGRRIDFRESDRFQLAMSVVQELERRLPLPPFEVWVADYLSHPDQYRRYAYELHRGEELP